MECKQIPAESIKKLSSWFKKISGDDEISRKTHRVFNGVSLLEDNTKLLVAEGSGTVFIRLEQLKAFNLDLIANNAFLRLSVGPSSVKLYCIYRGRFILLKEQSSREAGLVSKLQSIYWVSFEAKSRTILFGKNEPIFQNVAFSFALPRSNKSAEQYWMNKIAHYRIDTPAVIYSSKDVVCKFQKDDTSINLLSTRH